MVQGHLERVRQRLLGLEAALIERAPELAVFLVYDRPSRVLDRPGLAGRYFVERCIPDEQVEEMLEAFQSVGAYVELFEGEHPFIQALESGRLHRIGRPLRVVDNGLESGVTPGGFLPGRRALVPALADAYRLIDVGSNAYVCALSRHKFHYLTILRRLGYPVPTAWHYTLGYGWAGRKRPSNGIRVIAKSTYESWSIGVTTESVFVVDEHCEDKVELIAQQIGQPVTVQEFIPGLELGVPIFSAPDPVVSPVVESILSKAPRDPESFMTVEDNLAPDAVTFVGFNDSEALERLELLAIDVFNDLNLDGFARVDFRIAADRTIWLTDVGACPGVGRSSAAAASIALLGLKHAQLLRLVVATTLATHGLVDIEVHPPVDIEPPKPLPPH